MAKKKQEAPITNSKPNKRNGPPSTFKPEYIDMVDAAMEEGGSVVQLCAKIGCSEETMQRWRENNPEFDETVSAAITRSHAWWQAVGKCALANDKFNNTMYILQMRNRFKWLGKDPVTPVTIITNGISEESKKAHELALQSLSEKHNVSAS